jgi:pimeloyl-ACP methyl ester carboxylesterase
MGGAPSLSSSFSLSPGETAAEVTHVVVFAHGLTSSVTASDLAHGQALLAAHKELAPELSSGTAVHLSAANAGSSGGATLRLTTGGVEAGAARLAAEVGMLLKKRYPKATHVSLIGGSMGGLFACRAASLLCASGLLRVDGIVPDGGVIWAGLARIRVARLHALVTLATPHLGVLGLTSWSRAAWLGSWVTTGLGELLLQNDALLHTAQLCCAAPGAVGAACAVRVAYAPLIDDGVVAWESVLSRRRRGRTTRRRAAGGRVSTSRTETETEVAVAAAGSGGEEEGLEEKLPVHEGEEDVKGEALVLGEVRIVMQAQGRGDPAAKGGDDDAGDDFSWVPVEQREALQRLHRAWTHVPWTVVDVALPHKRLATLHATRTRHSDAPNEACVCVATDVLRRVLIDKAYRGAVLDVPKPSPETSRL